MTDTDKQDYWRAVAKFAGEFGVRYRTNTALTLFLDKVTTLSLPQQAATDTDTLREALLLYGRHTMICPVTTGDGVDCTCGYEKALATLSKPEPAAVGARLDMACPAEMGTMPDCKCPHEHWHIGAVAACLDIHVEDEGYTHAILDIGDDGHEIELHGVSTIDAARPIAFLWASTIIGEPVPSPSSEAISPPDAAQVIRDLMAAWPETHLPPHDLAIRAANIVNASSEPCPPDARAVVEALEEARRQLEYLDGKFTPTGTTAAVLARIDAALQSGATL